MSVLLFYGEVAAAVKGKGEESEEAANGMGKKKHVQATFPIKY